MRPIRVLFVCGCFGFFHRVYSKCVQESHGARKVLHKLSVKEMAAQGVSTVNVCRYCDYHLEGDMIGKAGIFFSCLR